MRTTTFSDLRNNLKKFLDGVINDSEPLIVHRPGDNSIVMISLEEYNALKETEYIMKSPETMKRIKAAEQEISEGKGKKIAPGDIWN